MPDDYASAKMTFLHLRRSMFLKLDRPLLKESMITSVIDISQLSGDIFYNLKIPTKKQFFHRKNNLL